MQDVAKRIYAQWLHHVQETPEGSRSMICNVHPAVNYRGFGLFLREGGDPVRVEKNECFVLPGERVVQVAQRFTDGSGFNIRGSGPVALLLLQHEYYREPHAGAVFANAMPLARYASTRVLFMVGDVEHKRE